MWDHPTTASRHRRSDQSSRLVGDKTGHTLPLTLPLRWSVHHGMPNNVPFPTEVARDVLGLDRAMYAAFQGMGPKYRDHLLRQGIDYQLQLALEKSRQAPAPSLAAPPGSSPRATEDLGALVDKSMPAQLLLPATGASGWRRRTPVSGSGNCLGQ